MAHRRNRRDVEALQRRRLAGATLLRHGVRQAEVARAGPPRLTPADLRRVERALQAGLSAGLCAEAQPGGVRLGLLEAA